jgi:type VI secretion system secreted protein VgrG
MATTYLQPGRLLNITSPLGENVLLLRGFNGHEELSRPFRYELDLLSQNDAIAAKEIVGKPVTWSVRDFDDQPRFFNGVVARFAAGNRGARGFRAYRAEVVPWFWMLTRGSDCRIFQNQTTPEIVQAVFEEYGFTDYQPSLSGSYEPWEYCVQYRETAFNFVSRLLEHEGIFYYFKHEDGKHTMMLVDAKRAYQDVKENQVKFSSGTLAPNHVGSWDHRYEFRSGKWAQADYNFETPSTSLLTNADTLVKLPGNAAYELYDYPGEYRQKSHGQGLTTIRMQEEEAPHDVVSGSGRCCTFTPGGKFTLQGHDIASEDGAYVVTSIAHSAVDRSLENEGGPSSYSNTFECIPAEIDFRPARITPRPFVRGPQPAVVVGPAGEEIYTDKYGRVKVQFFWDRQGKKDENSSCWIRVAETWAGKNWGMIFNPRIGQEVIVDFIEGDPDRPIITGRVYNAEQMPPYTLPANQTQSGVKSRSSKGGAAANFNELRFEDKKGEEQVYFHAEKDFDRVVENNDTLKVGFEKKDPGDQTIEVFNNQSLTVGAGKGGASDGSQTISVFKDRTETVETGNETVTVKQGNRTVNVNTGNDTHNIKTGNRAVVIDMGNDALTIKMGDQTTKLNLGKSETEAMQSIELKVGANSIKVDQTGVTIKGIMVKVEGQAMTQIKAPMTQVNGDGMLMAKGGIVMIN